MYQGALEGYERIRGRDKGSTLSALGKLGETYMLMEGTLDKAEVLLKEAFEGFERKFGEQDAATNWIAIRLWDVYSRQGNSKEAKRYADRVPRCTLIGFGENGTPKPPAPKAICAEEWWK